VVFILTDHQYVIGADPDEPMQIGSDECTPVLDYEPPDRLVGHTGEVRIYGGEVAAEQVLSRAAPTGAAGER